MGRVLDLTVTEPQAEFLQMRAKYPLFVAGFGTGKTQALALSAMSDALHAPNGLIALYEPTYDLVSLILAPRMQEMLTDMGIRYRYNQQRNTILTSSSGCGDFILRTLDNPVRIIGYESYRAHVDEIDTLPEEKATLAWRKIIARNRQQPRGVAKPFNRVSAYTTPEGFRFAYNTWARDPKPGYEYVQAATRSNPFLPPDYIEGLRASYPAQLIEAYLEGRFVNLTSGAVYPDFDRFANHTDEVMADGEELHIGQDFNVYNCTSVVAVVREGRPLIVGELTKLRDTPDVISTIKEKFPGHRIHVYPDASGQSNRTVNATDSDVLLLKRAGFVVHVPSRNPFVKERVMAVNGLVCNGEGARGLKINTKACPTLTECLEQQVYDQNGEPDKSAGKDHAPDALGYFIYAKWPIVKPTATHRAQVNFMGR